MFIKSKCSLPPKKIFFIFCLWPCGSVSTKRKSSSVDFVKNDEVDEDDNEKWFGSKLIGTLSVSIRSDETTISENEAVIWFRPLLFIVRCLSLRHSFWRWWNVQQCQKAVTHFWLYFSHFDKVKYFFEICMQSITCNMQMHS